MHPVEVVDRAGTGQRAHVEDQLRGTLGRFAAAEQGVRRPLRGVLEDVLVPGFTETQVEWHVLHLEAGAVGEAWFPGLLAREVAHAVLSDVGHPSHDPLLLQASFEAARERSRDVRFLSLVGALNHHARDIYADDLAARVDGDALRPFLEHLAARAADTKGSEGDVAVEAGYAAATLMRRGAPAPAPLRAVLAASASARTLADAMSGLHPDPEPPDMEQAVLRLVARLPLGG